MQNKKTESFVIDTDGLPDLPANHFEFLRLIIVEGRNQTEAYREAIAQPETKTESIWAKSCQLYNSSKIQQWVEAANCARLATIVKDRDDHLARMRELSLKAERTGNYGAAVQAEKAVGQSLGHYIERHEDVTAAFDIRTLTDSELAVYLYAIQTEFERRRGSELDQAVGEHVGSTQQ